MNSDALAGRSDLHILRKLWHVSCGAAALFCYYALNVSFEAWGWAAFGIGATGFALDFVRLKNPGVNRLAVKLLGPILRKSELESFSGLPFYAMGCALSIYFFQKDIALMSVFFLVFADPAASLVGVKFGKDQILPNKTLQGTLACFFVSYAIVTAYTWQMPVAGGVLLAFAFFGALAAAVGELFSAFNIDDNFTIPVVAGAGLTLANAVLGVF